MSKFVFRFVFLLLISSAVLAQPAIDVSITEINTFPLYPGFPMQLCYPEPRIIIKNTGTVPLQLGLSCVASNWHFDVVGIYGDTVRLWGEISNSISPMSESDTLIPYRISCSQRYSPLYFGTEGTVFHPGDSLFLHLLIRAPYDYWPLWMDTLTLFVYGRRDAVTVAEEISIVAYIWFCSIPENDSITITGVVSTPGTERVDIKAIQLPDYYGGDYYNVYRDTLPLFYIMQCIRDSLAAGFNLLPIHAHRYYSDNFTDTLWHHYSGGRKGVCDTLVNLFYVFTTVDTGASAPGGYAESFYPSNLICEYDQPFYSSLTLGGQNWISIPVFDSRIPDCRGLDSLIRISYVKEWNPISQVASTIGQKVGSTWILNGAIKVGHIYLVNGIPGSSPHAFSIFKPGMVPENDTSYTLRFSGYTGGRNVIMIPFKASRDQNIHDRATLETSIEDAGAAFSAMLMRIDKWNGSYFVWATIAQAIGPTTWSANPHLRPGMPYRIWIQSTTTPITFTWPPTSR